MVSYQGGLSSRIDQSIVSLTNTLITKAYLLTDSRIGLAHNVCVCVCVFVCCNFSVFAWLHECSDIQCIIDIVSNLYSFHNVIFLCARMGSYHSFCLLF